ncbi:MAG: hypothetical protein ACAI18_08470 [Gemmatimonadales bacterium]
MPAFVSRALALAAVLAATATAAEAQVGLTSNSATVALTATKAATLTLSAVTPTASLASITDNSTANNFTPVSVTTDWNLTAGSTVNLVGWFAVPAQALANGTSFIPSSRVQGRVGAAEFAAFNAGPLGSAGVAGGSLTLFSQSVVGDLLNTRTDQLDLRLDLTGTTTVAGDYTGTLNLQAIVQ